MLRGVSKGNGWKNHPAVRMWCGYELALIWYGIAMCEEWISRGYKDTMLPRFKELLPSPHIIYGVALPPWIGNEKVHRSHRSNLLRKKPEFYREFWPKETDKLDYVWPI